MNHRSPQRNSPVWRTLATIIDVLLLIVMLLILLLVTGIVYLNVAILAGGTYQERIPQIWIEAPLLGAAAFAAIAMVVTYWWYVRRTGSSVGTWVTGYVGSNQRSDDQEHGSAQSDERGG